MFTDRLTATLLSDVDIGQFDAQITGLQSASRKRVDRVSDGVENQVDEDEQDDGEGDVDIGEVHRDKCPCGKGHLQPNNLMSHKIELCKRIMKDKHKKEKEWKRDEAVTSRNPMDYCIQFILSFHPQKLMNYSKVLVCWDKGCAGHSGKSRTST